MLDPAKIAELRGLMEKATPAPWDTDTHMPNNEQEVSAQIVGPNFELLFESSNCSTRMTTYDADEDGHISYYDVGSSPNFDFVVAIRNAAPDLLRAAEEAFWAKDRKKVSELDADDRGFLQEAAKHLEAAIEVGESDAADECIVNIYEVLSAKPVTVHLTDGHGSSWPLCGPNCSLAVVRPGKVQCNQDAATCPERAGGGA